MKIIEQKVSQYMLAQPKIDFSFLFCFLMNGNPSPMESFTLQLRRIITDNNKQTPGQNIVMGNQLCNHDTRLVLETASNNNKIAENPSEIRAEDIKLKCEICSEERASTKLKDHYDRCHFATLVEKTPIQDQVTCLLCNLKSDSLEQHKNHLKYKHLYMQSVTRKNNNEQKTNNNLQINANIKKRVKQILKNQFQINSDGTAQIRNQKYNVSSFSKEYGAMEFDEDKTTGDLVWKEVFDQNREASCFYIEFIPQQKNIKGQAKIFTKSSLAAKKANAS